MKNIFKILVICLLVVLCLASCNGGGGDGGGTDSKYKVTLVTGAGAQVVGENPVYVENGGSCDFVVRLEPSYVFHSAKSHGREVGSFDANTATFTVSDVRGDMRIEFNTSKIANTYYYDLNGGNVNSSSGNMTATDYYVATVAGDDVKVSLKSEYADRIGVASTFWDDGSFTRAGFILKEYNTKADGSGEGFGLGSKFPLNLESTVLYCIWERESDKSDFEYCYFAFPRPDGVTAKTAPHWVEEGVMITKYNGNSKTVTIPEKLDDKYVIAIGEGAFLHKDIETLVMGRRILKIEDNAFVGCDKINTIYYPDGIYSIGNGAFDSASYTNLHNLYVNATIAPRYSAGDGAFAMKFARLLSNSDKKRIIVIAGSSAYQGLSSEYMEALLDGEYCVVNFGTTRTTHGYMYLEAMQYYAKEGDIILYAPENSSYMMGERRLYYKTLRDMEGMYNIFRHIDIANYENVFGAFCALNSGVSEEEPDFKISPRYTRAENSYEEIINNTAMNAYGEYGYYKREGYFDSSNYKDAYLITLNNRFKSRFEGAWNNIANQQANFDYKDLNNPTWCSVDDAEYKDQMNRVIGLAKSSGAKVYFSFAPADASSLCSEARENIVAWCDSYDRFIESTYDFDGIMGKSVNYIMNRQYFYDCAFHPNDYGRTYRSYTLYRDISEELGLENIKGMYDAGVNFEGCLFENTVSGEPLYPAY